MATIAAICTVIFGFIGIFFWNKVAQKYPERCKWLLLCTVSIFLGSLPSLGINLLGVNITSESAPSNITEPLAIYDSESAEAVVVEEDIAEETVIPDVVVSNTGIDVQSPDTIVNEMQLISESIVFQPATASVDLFSIANSSIIDFGITEITSLTEQDQFCALLTVYRDVRCWRPYGKQRNVCRIGSRLLWACTLILIFYRQQHPRNGSFEGVAVYL
ncbi:hypothetical protein RFF05_02725 [Bengtsoniella intestinalis]|uniref:hypothetical protein n=1 Tax=Bengtsoniella intestinalis TaxID=3073143 RepID=UPI00391FADF7